MPEEIRDLKAEIAELIEEIEREKVVIVREREEIYGL